MSYVAYFFPPIVYIGVVLATLSASMSNMLGASRVLHAIASDRVLGPVLDPLFIGRHCNCCSNSCCNFFLKNEYLGPLLLTFALTSGVLALGDMNSIAPYSSQFFLFSYAMVNLSCMMLIWAGAPNFRPTFRQYNIYTCSLGVLITLVLMFYLQPTAAAVCVALFFSLTFVIYLRFIFWPSQEMEWGSVAQAVIFHTVRKYLLKLDFRREHVKFWRPHLLLLVSNPRKCCPLIDALNDLKKSGIYILGHVQLTESLPRDLTEEYTKWQEVVDHLKVKAFVSLTESKSFRAGAIQIVRVSGLGALKPNTVMLGFRDANAEVQDFLTMDTSKYFMKPEKRSNLPSTWHPVQAASPAADEVNNSNNSSDSASTPGTRMSDHDYVGLINDILNARKNIGLCRNFHLLDKNMIER